MKPKSALGIPGYSESARCLEDFGDMARYSYLSPRPTNNTFAIEQKGAALDAHVFASVHAFLDPDAVFLADVRAGVGGENKGQLVLLLEFVVRRDRIFRDPDDHRTRPAIVRKRIAEPARLGGTARCVVLRIKIEHHLFALELGQRDAAVAVGRQREIGSLVAKLDIHRALS